MTQSGWAAHLGEISLFLKNSYNGFIREEGLPAGLGGISLVFAGISHR